MNKVSFLLIYYFIFSFFLFPLNLFNDTFTPPACPPTDQLSLLKVLSHLEEIFPLLSDEKVQEQLTPHLPPTLQNTTELYQTLTSPQFQEAVNSMEHVIQSGQLLALLGSSGISLEGVSMYGGTSAFLKAIQNDADKEKGSDS